MGIVAIVQLVPPGLVAPFSGFLAAVASATMAMTRPSIWSLLPWVVSRPAELTAANVAGGLAESNRGRPRLGSGLITADRGRSR